ncbi:HAD-IA family hydrolase [Vibrio sp. TH_r3]|uniref:HAD family hydrolase n=1 Tax=Vibrio sp. TH_r3 TaxID=3082084 RepID=UPI002955D04D|nr:HAD-IA family hydrolase [Vibrio sp. TH_r3]MDV7103460.1 HAD-IA family hydrolase [Vibrio sp. TH_r3]
MAKRLYKIRCVLFDCDGVLIDSERLCCKALMAVFSKYNPQLNINDFMVGFQGGKVADILAHAIQRLNINVAIDDVELAYRDHVNRLFLNELQPIRGVISLLDKLVELGIEYCVVSNSRTEKMEESLQLVGIKDRFEGKIFSAFEANSWKPDPDLLLYAAMNMGYSTNECLYIDDTAKGVAAGNRAGITTIHFNSNGAAYSCLSENALEIQSLEELSQLLEITSLSVDEHSASTLY